MFNFLVLFSLVAISSARIYSYENADGSYTLGHTSDSNGESENAILALLTKAAGYTTNTNGNTNEEYVESVSAVGPGPSEEDEEVISPVGPGKSLLTPHLEILQLVEAFIKLKGEVASRIQDVILDNYDLFKSLYSTFISKIGKLHTFTLIGIKIVRKILEFAVSLIGQWQKPSVSLSGQISSIFSY